MIRLDHVRRLCLALSSMFALYWLFQPHASFAQVNVTADWSDLNKSSLEVVNDGETLDVGVNTVTIDTNVVTDGDSNDASFTNFYSTGMLSYYAGQVSSFTGGLLYSTDHTVFDAGDYFESVFNFDTQVSELAFTVGNVDRFFGSVNFHDAVVIEYDTGDGIWRNLRSLSGSTTLGSVVGTTTINGQQGYHGTAYTGGITSVSGDIRVDFGATTVTRVRIRYLFGQASPGTDVSGNWQYMGLSDFTWEQSVANTADLSLTKLVSNGSPNSGAAINYTLTLSNTQGETATGVEVLDQLPTGFSFASASGDGTYNSTTGIWLIPSIAAGQSRTLIISGTVTAPGGTSVTNYAEVSSSPFADLDSTPGNFSVGEDDDATATFTVQGSRSPGIPPTLACPAGVNLFDWDIRTWIAGSLSNQYNVTNFGDVGFDITSVGTFVNDAAFGGQSPTVTSTNSGGLATAEDSLHLYLDFANRQQTATAVISLPNGVAGAQFTIFDVDFAANDFADKVTVTGSYQGSTVIPQLTNGVANYVVGNTAIGDILSGNNSGNGNVVVTFSQAVDTITIVYGNATTAPVVPDGQAVALHDISICAPETDLSVTKVSSVISDPINLTPADNPKAIPGARVEYLISVANIGISDADNVVITDSGPPEAKLCLIDRSGGPIIANDPGSNSGLTYSFSALNSNSDDLEFSNDGGTTWLYEPTPDGEGCDTNITNFRVSPGGTFAASSDFTVTVRYIIE